MNFAALPPSQILGFGTPCAELIDLYGDKKQAPIDWSDSKKALATLRYAVSMMEKSDQPDPDVKESIVDITSRHGAAIPLTVFQPSTEDSGKPRPLIVLFHAGGFVMGNAKTLSVLARPLVKKFNAVIAAPAYRLAPEHAFPAAVEDAWDSIQWLSEHSTTIGADAQAGFIVGGISSGALLANVVSHLARDETRGPRLTGVFLSCGSARPAAKDASRLAEEYRVRSLSRTQPECTTSQFSTPEMSRLSVQSYQPDINSELYAPLLWHSGHNNLPRTYSQVCGMEPARDEALIYDDMLKKCGVSTRLDLYPGLPHTFFHTYPKLPQAQKWWKDTMEGFAWLLAGDEA